MNSHSTAIDINSHTRSLARNLAKAFDKAYSSEEPTFGDRPSEELRDYILTSGLTGDALDIGCGDGRDTLFLASMGFNVTAIDISRIALLKLMSFARQECAASKGKYPSYIA